MSPMHSTTVRWSKCACGGDVLAAWDDGLHARVDAIPIAEGQDEWAAHRAGLDTYTQTRNGHLIRRDPTRHSPLGPLQTIHVQHQCTRGMLL